MGLGWSVGEFARPTIFARRRITLAGLENADKLHSLHSCKAVPDTEANHLGEILRDKWLRQCQSLLVAVP